VTLRLAVDFGTATTCVATIRNLSTLEPELVPIENNDLLSDSVVWSARPEGRTPLVGSKNKYGRVPLQLFEPAKKTFEDYWRERVKAQSDGVAWYNWRKADREQSTLLRYFKPELADEPGPAFTRLPGAIAYRYNPITESSDVTIEDTQTEVSNPDPDTDDLVAATAALLRRSVDCAVTMYREKVQRLVIGVPSFGTFADGEGKRSCDRRREAVKLARIADDFGTPDFELSFVGEAEAAGFGLDLPAGSKEVYAIVVDMGAGTTDLGLIPFNRESGRWMAGPPILQSTIRFAGRDINIALANGLCSRRELSLAREAMDDRSWRYLVEDGVEGLKRDLTNEEQQFKISLPKYAAKVESIATEDSKVRALRKTVFYDLSLQSGIIRSAVHEACRPWRDEIASFLLEGIGMLEKSRTGIGSIEMMGGAFRFEPLRHALKAAVTVASLGHVPLRFRDAGGEAQTVVARGLARWVALQR
jgi:molecular chaperone DnaK (HSP70)